MAGPLLITGSSGMIGRELTRQLLRHSDRDLTLLLHRQGRRLPRHRLLRDLFGLTPSPSLIRRVRVIEGDVTQPRMGLSERRAAQLAEQVDGVLHAAASTRFDQPLQAARRINVEGVKHVARFASRCRQLLSFGLLSTVFVSGRRQGTILESERKHDCGFVNAYEQSKYEAEAWIETTDLPYAIYRLSTLVGNSETGTTTHFTAPHQSLRIMHLGLASMVPGKPDCPVDLIPTDWAASTVVQLFLHRFRPRRVHHLVAGPASYNLAQVIEDSYAWLGRLDPAWAGRRYVRPTIASPQAFRLLIESAAQARDSLMMGVLSPLGQFAEQFLYPKVFDTASLDGIARPPDIRSYYGRVVAYCLKTNWGRRG